jgi:hypothetical protein
MSMPVGDWQFWVVTGIAAVALWFVLREAVPWWPWKRRGKGKAASLTIEGKAPKK